MGNKLLYKIQIYEINERKKIDNEFRNAAYQQSIFFSFFPVYFFFRLKILSFPQRNISNRLQVFSYLYHKTICVTKRSKNKD